MAQAPGEVKADDRRRAATNAAKLRALVAGHFHLDADDATAVGAGAAVVTGDGRASRAFVLVDGDHRLGAALAVALRNRASALDVVVPMDDDDGPDAGVLARQAAEFSSEVRIWALRDAVLSPVAPAPWEPGSGPPDAPELVAAMEAAGLDVVVEGDRLAGEFRGLEVARVVRALDDSEPILEVGVGRFDRALTAMIHGELDDIASLDRVVEQLREIRRPGARPHPLAALVPERWLRTVLLSDPGSVGCSDLAAAPSPEPRDRLRPRGIAVATGGREGRPVVVACAVGVDLEAPVRAADARAALSPEAELLLAIPHRDALAVTRSMVAELRRPAAVVTVDDDWRR